MNRTIKLILAIVLSILVIFSIPIYSNARQFTLDDIFNDGKNFLDEGDTSVVITPEESKLKELSNTVSGVLLTIAFGVAIISIAVMGINFAVQNVEDKAKIKESMVPWVIGIFVSFGAFGIWKMTMAIFYKL